MKNAVTDLKAIFNAGVKRVDPYGMIMDNIKLTGSILQVKDPQYDITFDLDEFERVVVIGTGKATANMAKAVEDILGGRISEGLISVKYGHTAPLDIIEILEAGHPIPDENSVLGARRIAGLAREANEKTLVITLISGGGSALMSSPARIGGVELTLEDKQKTTALLLESGATINEINCIRKHCSGIKGGRLAELIYPARSLNIILSDVVGDRLDAIASGPTSPDSTTFREGAEIISKYDLEDKLPSGVSELFKLGLNGGIDDTPGEGSPLFEPVNNVLIGTNYQSLLACSSAAESLGYQSVILSSQIVGEAKEVAKALYGIAKDVKKHGLLKKLPVCLIAGGETTVTLTGGGKGGRNQEIALSVLSQMEKAPEEGRDICFLSASTDGNDGPTDAAGAFAFTSQLDIAREKGLSINAYLKENDSYHFFTKTGYLLKTGPTNTNVCDIHLFLIR